MTKCLIQTEDGYIITFGKHFILDWERSSPALSQITWKHFQFQDCFPDFIWNKIPDDSMPLMPMKLRLRSRSQSSRTADSTHHVRHTRRSATRSISRRAERLGLRPYRSRIRRRSAIRSRSRRRSASRSRSRSSIKRVSKKDAKKRVRTEKKRVRKKDAKKRKRVSKVSHDKLQPQQPQEAPQQPPPPEESGLAHSNYIVLGLRHDGLNVDAYFVKAAYENKFLQAYLDTAVSSEQAGHVEGTTFVDRATLHRCIAEGEETKLAKETTPADEEESQLAEEAKHSVLDQYLALRSKARTAVDNAMSLSNTIVFQYLALWRKARTAVDHAMTLNNTNATNYGAKTLVDIWSVITLFMTSVDIALNELETVIDADQFEGALIDRALNELKAKVALIDSALNVLQGDMIMQLQEGHAAATETEVDADHRGNTIFVD